MPPCRKARPPNRAANDAEPLSPCCQSLGGGVSEGPRRLAVSAGPGAALAQLVEHLIRNEGVGCSSHPSGTTFPFPSFLFSVLVSRGQSH